MRPFLLAAAAAAPLALAAAPALAQTSITTATSTPQKTSTTGDLSITAAGVLTVGAAGAGVTVDSNNTVTNAGSITSTDVNNVTGILLNGGRAGTITNTGSITLTETFTGDDSANADGVVEAPFAKGQNKFGIRLVGPGAYTGDILHLGGAITVRGVNSYGISLEAPLQGALTIGASVSQTGDNGAAVRETAGVAGSVLLNAAVSASGQNSSGAVLTGDVGGAVSVYSAIVSSGYSTLSRPSTAALLALVQKTPADLQQSGPALLIGGNLARGLFIGAPPSGTATGSTADLDGDGLADGVEGTGSIVNYGSAPGVLVGATGKAITLGAFGVDANAYGMIVRGTISGNGVFDGVSATGLQLGVAGGTVALVGGLRNVGAITATSYEADAVGARILAGTSVPYIANEGGMSGTIAASTGASTARGLLIEAGASTPTLANGGGITALAVGDKASAVALADRSGTLSTLNNTGVISAVITPTTLGVVASGAATAIDLSANTTGVRLRQEANASGTTPSIVGDILLGSGPNAVQLAGGTITGALSLGSAASSFDITNGAAYTGALRYGGSALALNVASGTLSLTSPTTLRLSTLNVGATSTLRFAIDPAAGTATQLAVSGPATLATGAQVALNVLTSSSTARTYTLVSSPQLSLGALNASSLTSLPFLVSATLIPNASAGVLQLSVRRRTAVELGLNTSEAPALDAVANGVNVNATASAALLGQTTQTGFASAFRQFLPERGEGVFRFSEAAARQLGEATAEADAFADGGHIWAQQMVVGYAAESDPTREASRAGGYGGAAGYQTDQGPFGALGATAMLTIGNTESPDRPSQVQTNITGLTAGGYWRARMGGLRLEASGSAGYLWLHGVRTIGIDATGTSNAFGATSVNDHDAYTLAARVGASYQFDFGRYFARPQAHLDYFYLNESSYAETGGGAGVDLTVGGRTGSMTSGVGSLVLGARFGDESGTIWRPSFEVGARDIFTGDTGALAAGFGAATNTFVLNPLDLKGTNTMAKVKLSAGGKGYDFDLEAAGEQRDRYYEGALRAVARLSF